MFAFFPLLSLLVLVAAVLSAPLAARDGSGAVTGAVGLGFYSPSLTLGTKGYPDPNTYTCYSGPASNFPAPSKWMSFDNMWTLLHSAALTPIGDSPAEVQAIKNAILSISSSAKVDARVILAVIVLESTGNVRVGCTNNGVENCGLMQSHDPTVKVYNPHNMQASITQMVSRRPRTPVPPS
jgi:glucan 1,3-beta-glucosidase